MKLLPIRARTGVAAILCVILIVVIGCNLDEVSYPTRNEDSIQLTHMGSLGNSLTAGFQNGGIEETGQMASFANLLSGVISKRTMQMPLVMYPGIGSESGYSPLFVDPSGDVTRAPLTVDPTQLAKNLTYPLPYDNLGVPGATTHQILTTMFAEEVGNPLFDLILRNVALPGGGTCMGQLERLRPDFITAWSGNNEILGGALSGSPQNTDPGMPETYIVPVEAFKVDFLAMCNRIEALQPKIVAIANVPPITAIPYTRFFCTGSLCGLNRWTMDEDNDGDDDRVQLVLLTAPISDCIPCYLPSCGGAGTPCRSIPAENTLTFAEVELIDNTIAAYNEFIESEVKSRGWAFIDVFAAFMEIRQNPSATINVNFPLVVNPLTGEASQNKASAFTLDGVHPSERGHAVLANEFLESINGVYGTTYPLFDIAQFNNVAGFENFTGTAAKASAHSVITAEAREGLESMVEMFSVSPRP